MSAYTEARAALMQVRKGPPCTMGQLVAGLDPDSAADLQADLDNPFVQGTDIGRNLATMERPIGQHVIDRHRRGECGCHR